MIETNNAFLKHTFLWVLTLPFLAVFLMPAMLSVERLQVPATERDTLLILGQDPDDITGRANDAFTKLFLNTGIKDGAEKLFRSKGGSLLGRNNTGERNIVSHNHRYLDAFWLLIYRAIWRFMGLWPALCVLLIAVAIPAVIDGAVIHQTKQDQFRSNNPVIFWASAHTAISVAGAFLFLPLLPIPISLYVLYGSVAILSLTLWSAAHNLQTGS